MATGLGRWSTVCGVLIAAGAVAGCTGEDGGAARAHGPTVSRSASTAATVAPALAAGSVHPTGAARLGPKDGALKKWITTTSLPKGFSTPDLDMVVVIHRGRRGTGEVGWISGDGYCLGHTFVGGGGGTLCGPYSVAQDPSVPRTGRMTGVLDHVPDPDEAPENYGTLAVVVGDAGPFYFTGDEERGFLYQAQATMEPGRTVTFLEWGYTGGPSLPLHPALCSRTTPRCLHDD